jgi:hypothetical protein
LVALVDWNLLEFHRGFEFGKLNLLNLAYFRVLGIENPQIGPRLKDLAITYSSVATQTVDDVLLGPLEDVGMLLETNVISLEQAYDEFSSYVEDCAGNEAIQAYIS